MVTDPVSMLNVQNDPMVLKGDQMYHKFVHFYEGLFSIFPTKLKQKAIWSLGLQFLQKAQVAGV